MKTNGSPSLNLDAEKIDQPLKIAVIDEDEGWEMVSRLLGGDGRFSLSRAADGDQLMEMLGQDGIDCVIIESITGNESGFAINERIRARDAVMPPAIMLTRLGREETAIQAFRSGFSDYLNKNKMSNDSLPAAIFRATRAKRLEQARLDKTARLSALGMHDELTGLCDRNYLDSHLAKMLESAARNHRPVAALLIDIDHFKFVNDNYGRVIGDLVLCRFSEKLKQAARRSDTFGRYGADEFLYLIDQDVSPESVGFAGRRLADALSFNAEFEEVGLRLSASIGAAIYPDAGNDAETVIKAATTALSWTKASGGGFRLASTRPAGQQPHQLNGTADLSAPLKSNGAQTLAPSGARHLTVSSDAGIQPGTLPVAEFGSAKMSNGSAFGMLDASTVAQSPGIVNRKDNRRAEPRHRVCKHGQIVTKNGLSTIDCVVRDMSEGGVRIATEGKFGLPDQFYFQLSGTKSRILAEKRWQDGKYAGLKFLPDEIAR